ncbi:MAG: cell division topological specificity factor MinE [Anaerolineales bacterium]|nr:cell division topological specificity factor MinE [Anaerolineales bacterium]MCB8954760.1 cell division topological specificity factor MinE [Ardenticatenales bacterium]
MSWISRLLGKEEKSSAVAKNRLKMVLQHDRNDISPGLIELIKDDIIQVIARHLAIEPDKVEVNLTQTATESRLVAEIPLDGKRRPTSPQA